MNAQRDYLADWGDCLNTNNSIKVTKNIQRAKSLIETSLERIKYVNKNLNKNTANFIFEDYYTSILEILEAITSLEGYKVLNHICLGFYLRDILKREDLYRIFNDLRFKRNSLVYYGKIPDISSKNSKLVWKYLLDMEHGLNVANGSKKGCP